MFDVIVFAYTDVQLLLWGTMGEKYIGKDVHTQG